MYGNMALIPKGKKDALLHAFCVAKDKDILPSINQLLRNNILLKDPLLIAPICKFASST